MSGSALPTSLVFPRTLQAALAFLLAGAAPAMAGSYSYTTIDVGEGSTGTIASGVNAQGVVTGWYDGGDGTTHGFTWSAGIFTSFDAIPGAGATLPVAINGRGQVVENFISNAGGNRIGFLREPDGVQHKLPFPASVSVQVNAINGHGAIIGDTLADAHASPIGFLLIDHVVTPLLVPGSSTSTADAINDSGAVAGTFIDASGPGGYIYTAGTYTIFRAPRQNAPQPSAINAAGLVSGAYLDVTHHGTSATDRGFTFGHDGFHSFNPVWSLNTWIAKAFAPGDYVGTMESPVAYEGFVFRNGHGIPILPPDAASGYVVGGTQSGIVVGNYTDRAGMDHGFMAACPTAQAPCTK
jgi:uncharacterized membrane protein